MTVERLKKTQWDTFVTSRNNVGIRTGDGNNKNPYTTSTSRKGNEKNMHANHSFSRLISALSCTRKGGNHSVVSVTQT